MENQNEQNKPEEKSNEQQQTISPEEWLKQEQEDVGQHEEFDKLPSLQFIENKNVEFDISKDDLPFGKWYDTDRKSTKKIIPVTHDGEKKNLWLNVKNPLYKQILDQLAKDITHFKVMQVGNQDKTKYILVEE